MKKFKFSIDAKNGNGRAGTLRTCHGSIKTPVFMPVGTHGSVKAIFQKDLEEQKVEIILANTYHLMLRPGENLIKKLGGLHNFINWQKPILTDSGGFQVWSLSKLRKVTEDGINFVSHIDGKKIKLTPESAIKIQQKLNSDISMVLDECTEYPASFKRARESMELSLRWAKRCKNSFKNRDGFGLFGIVQGGMYKELRKECSEKLSEIGFDGYAIGGLSVGETHDEMINIVGSSIEYLEPSKPRYLMGVGRPIDIFNSVEKGVDMFDCVLPTRFGRNGRAFTSQGEINLRNSCFSRDDTPLDKNVNCYASQRFSKSYLHHLTKSNEILSAMILSLHNVAFYKKMMSDIRESIINKTFKKIKENYLRYHGKYKKNKVSR
jgi:queuine tRNA-ribosyltransferase